MNFFLKRVAVGATALLLGIGVANVLILPKPLLPYGAFLAEYYGGKKPETVQFLSLQIEPMHPRPNLLYGCFDYQAGMSAHTCAVPQ